MLCGGTDERLAPRGAYDYVLTDCPAMDARLNTRRTVETQDDIWWSSDPDGHCQGRATEAVFARRPTKRQAGSRNRTPLIVSPDESGRRSLCPVLPRTTRPIESQRPATRSGVPTVAAVLIGAGRQRDGREPCSTKFRRGVRATGVVSLPPQSVFEGPTASAFCEYADATLTR